MKYIVKNKTLGDILVFGFGLLNNKTLIQICDARVTPFVIAKGFNVEDGTWVYGTYYQDLIKAHKDFLSE